MALLAESNSLGCAHIIIDVRQVDVTFADEKSHDEEQRFGGEFVRFRFLKLVESG